MQTTPGLIQHIRLARQPIVDRDLVTMGYELLYRAQDVDQVARISNSNQATASVVINALTEIGLDILVGTQQAFVNVPLKLLFNEVLKGISSRQLVLEILETVECNESTAGAMNALKASGFRLALDDFPADDLSLPCVAAAHYVKLDVLSEGAEKIAQTVEKAHAAGLKVVAEKVEEWSDFELLKAAGVDFFQGHFYARPEMIIRQSIRANKANLLSLLILLQDENVAMDAVTEKINTDLALTYRLLRLVNSAAIGMRRKVESVADAVRMLGLNTIRSMVYLSALTGVDGKPPALIKTAMIRARFAELLAKKTGMASPPSAFMVGLFSTLDAFYDQPIRQIVDELPLSDSIASALVSREGSLGEILEYVIFYERGVWLEGDEVTEQLNAVAPQLYVEAVNWAEQMN
ncbi:EAL and HDOD domain-containing protein [Halothiobacillus sp. DCM-1]|uniref:EAL and HDOD domain-containing protein n=1 Tax=Halothiobacillus sp. DCM-1 TaxID=3112558 RepID=UPI003246DD13